jgi:hypothetical protein
MANVRLSKAVCAVVPGVLHGSHATLCSILGSAKSSSRPPVLRKLPSQSIRVALSLGTLFPFFSYCLGPDEAAVVAGVVVFAELPVPNKLAGLLPLNVIPIAKRAVYLVVGVRDPKFGGMGCPGIVNP